ncbi:MAG: threonine synthase [Tissierellia bacterium]|nr:threonine synthase [Tissierellia bacterium]
MKFTSTRGHGGVVTGKEAIVQGLAPDGGLFMPEVIPQVDWRALPSWEDYPQLAAEILHLYLTDYSREELLAITRSGYEKFEPGVFELEVLDDTAILELFHGPTLAFKDFALALLSRLIAAGKGPETIRILTATSGDTGKAALAGFQDVPGMDIFVFYPTDGVSSMQKLQMQTQEGENVHVYGVRGNFDDAQGGVKAIFANEEIRRKLAEEHIHLSSANSINIGRLLPQLVYYFAAYLKMVDRGIIESGEVVDVSVPTGNFGDILAGYLAKEMGLPLGHFTCASNENDVLTKFFETGHYSANRPLVKTTSPSMDILVSSNLERFLHLVAEDKASTGQYMRELTETGEFTVDELPADMTGAMVTQGEVEETIGAVYEKFGYVLDPHTAVAYLAAQRAQESGRKKLVLATASPYKFPEAVARGLGLEVAGEEPMALLEAISRAWGREVPPALSELMEKPRRHTEVIAPEEMKGVIQ